MEVNAYLGELSAGIIYLLAGVRLALLGARTGEIPERFLGVSFILLGVSGVCYCLPDIDTFSAFETPLYFTARVAYLPGVVLVAAFTARVFRSDDHWARWLVWGFTALVVAGVAGSVAVGDWEGFSLSNRWFWLEWVGYTLPFGWAAAEALGQFRKARRRMRVGLCEPSVCNRMLLWCLFGALQFVSCVFVLGQYAAYERENVFSATWDYLYSSATLTALVVMWFAFFPPRFYVRWVNAASADFDSAHNG